MFERGEVCTYFSGRGSEKKRIQLLSIKRNSHIKSFKFHKIQILSNFFYQIKMLQLFALDDEFIIMPALLTYGFSKQMTKVTNEMKYFHNSFLFHIRYHHHRKKN